MNWLRGFDCAGCRSQNQLMRKLSIGKKEQV
jgi:hypothetical protein